MWGQNLIEFCPNCIFYPGHQIYLQFHRLLLEELVTLLNDSIFYIEIQVWTDKLGYILPLFFVTFRKIDAALMLNNEDHQQL